MKFAIWILFLIPAWYCLSFAKSNWQDKNRIGAVGAVLMSITTAVLPALYFFKGR